MLVLRKAHARMEYVMCKMTPSVLGTEQHCYRGKEVCGLNSESSIFSKFFVRTPGTLGGLL